MQLLKEQCSPPQPVREEVAAAPPADEEDMGSRANRKPSSRALNTQKEREMESFADAIMKPEYISATPF